MKIRLLFRNIGIIMLANLFMGCTSQVAQPGNAAAQVPENPKIDNPATQQVSQQEEYMYKVLVAEIAGQRGHYALSAEYFFDVAKQTHDVYLAERATRVALHAQAIHLAVKAAQLWVELAPGNPKARQILGSILLRQQRVEEALIHLEVLLDKIDNNTDQYMEAIATLLGAPKDQSSALELMQKLVEKRPEDPSALLIYAHLLIHIKQYPQALTILQQLIDLVPDHTQAIPLYAHVLNEQNKSEQALQWLEQALARYPTKQEWRLMYARMLANAQQFTQAIEQFQWLLPNYPDKADILYALGILSLQTEQLKTAKEYFKKLVHSEERLNTAYYYLGQIAETEDNLAQALSWYQKVDDGSNYLNAQARIALILVEQGQLDKALRHLHMVPVDNDEEALILTQFEAELLIEKQYYKRAMAVYNRALADEPDNVELLYMRALLAEKMGAITQLEQDLRRVLALEPDNVQALNALGYTLADHTQRYQEAYELIKQALSLRPNDYYILDSMGWVLYRMGHYAQAIKYLQKALEQQFDPEVSAHLGEILWNSGDREAAEAIWNKALEAFPDNPKLLEVIQRFLP